MTTSTFTPQWSKLKQSWPAFLLTWLPFTAILAWSIRFNPLNHVPAYGDVLEVMWGQEWYAEALRQGRNPLFYSQVFYPAGWHTAILAHTPLFLLAMGLTRLLLPAALVYNLFALSATVIAYLGMRRWLQLYINVPWIITAVALLFAFWGMRWPRIGGHLHTAWLSALLPWQAWLLQDEQPRARVVLWSGLIWALEIIASLYGVWLGALVLVLDWISQPTWPRLKRLLLIALLTFMLSTPTLFMFWQAQRASDALFYPIDQISGWGASLNALVAPTLYQTWLRPWTQMIYAGRGGEGSILNFGIVASGLALIGLGWGFQRTAPRQRYVLWLFMSGLLLALGPILQWDSEPITVPALRTFDNWLWQLGHSLKPALFPKVLPLDWQQAVPLPAWLFYALLPLSEGARVAARFGFVASLGLFSLVALTLARIRYKILAGCLTLLLFMEIVPWQVFTGVPWPPAVHPALEWLAKQPGAANQSVLILEEAEKRHLAVAISGETLYASYLMQKPTVSGIGSFFPRTTYFISEWFWSHSQPLVNADLQPLLWGYDVQWVVLPVRTKAGRQYLAQQDLPALTFTDCFKPPADATAWPDTLCILAVKPPPSAFNVTPREGWSGAEEWGRWAEGLSATAVWVAPLARDYTLNITAFPNCLKNVNQAVQVRVNDQAIGILSFTGCDQAMQMFVVPKNVVKIGWNTLNLWPKYAVSPAQLTHGKSTDTRLLAAGFTQLLIQPVQNSSFQP